MPITDEKKTPCIRLLRCEFFFDMTLSPKKIIAGILERNSISVGLCVWTGKGSKYIKIFVTFFGYPEQKRVVASLRNWIIRYPSQAVIHRHTLSSRREKEHATGGLLPGAWITFLIGLLPGSE